MLAAVLCALGHGVATTNATQRITILGKPFLPYPSLSYPFCSA